MSVDYKKEDEKIPHENSVFGYVSDTECLIRTLYEPEHIVEGVLQPSAIPSKDLECRGFSLDRAMHVQETVVNDRIRTQMAKLPDIRQLHIKIRFSCFEMRNIYDSNGNNEFVVMDTPSIQNPAHASLYAAYLSPNSPVRKSELKRKRFLLLGIFQDLL